VIPHAKHGRAFWGLVRDGVLFSTAVVLRRPPASPLERRQASKPANQERLIDSGGAAAAAARPTEAAEVGGRDSAAKQAPAASCGNPSALHTEAALGNGGRAFLVLPVRQF
jgi:hypothetical protein